MTEQRSSPAARAVWAAAALAALTAPQSLAQQPPAPQHRERGSLVFENIPLPDTALMARLGRYQQSRQATFLDWLADGSVLIATRFGDTEQLHRVAAPLGMREQLTFYQDPTEWARGRGTAGGLVWAHDGRRVAFYGNDRDSLSYDVYVADVTSGAAPQLLVGGRLDTWYP